MTDRVIGVLLIAATLGIGLWWMGATLGWDIIPQIFGVVSMVLGLSFMLFLGVLLVWPDAKK